MKTIGLKFPKKKARGKAAPEGQKAASAEDQKAEG